jgi:cold shock CspA family protein/ribosome-associated translation inhibitor RaiA
MATGSPRLSVVAKREALAGGLTPQITLHGIGPSPAIERALRRKLSWLRRYYPRITGCRVTVEAPHRHHRKGRLYCVRVDVTVPGRELAAARRPSLHHAHEDVLVAIRDAFDATRRELMDYARRRRGQVKTQAGMQHGRVRQLEADHGFLETADGRDIYFHCNSVLGRFERLVVGTKVRFVEEAGDEGPQASTVAIVRSGSIKRLMAGRVRTEPASRRGSGGGSS